MKTTTRKKRMEEGNKMYVRRFAPRDSMKSVTFFWIDLASTSPLSIYNAMDLTSPY